jgi:glycosyltransferase involved in cell wall biosynthesis
MRIGIDASRAFLKRRTGIEEYSYRVIEYLRNEIPTEQVTLYVQKKLVFKSGRPRFILPRIDFEIPKVWRVKGLWSPRFWTQARLSLEILAHTPDVLFIPAHTVPVIHPKKTIVTIHGLEYEFSPESYSFWERLYMRLSIRYSVSAASQIIAVSENTKRDLARLYAVPEKKIKVLYEGFTKPLFDNQAIEKRVTPYFFFVGRLETRKNIVRVIEAFETFKTKTGLSHQLILAGKPGYGYGAIQEKIGASKYKENICEVGYVSEEEKWRLLKNSEAFLFPSLYEGFGLPVIEAQSVGVPVITANTSSLPEIAGEGAILVNPPNVSALAEAMEELVKNQAKRADIIDKAIRNVDHFSWARCAQGVADLLVGS